MEKNCKSIKLTFYHKIWKITNYFKVLETNLVTEKFEWNEYDQGLILGAFFWFHWTTQIPGGLLAQMYGTKKVYGYSNLSGVICCMLIPLAAYFGMRCLVILRCIQGIFCVRIFFKINFAKKTSKT